MIVVDANLLIYAIDADAAHHSKVVAWWEKLLSGDEEVGLAWIVLLAFVRITTHPRILVNPLEPAEALDIVDRWLAQPFVKVVPGAPAVWALSAELIRYSGTGGNLTNDAFLAALAISEGATLCSADNDFRRFKGLSFVNPLDEG